MLPYHLGLRIKLGVQRLVSKEPLYNRVLPGWYIGGWPWSGSELPSDAPSVLDCTCELPRTHRNRYLCLPVWDTQAPSAAVIERGVAFALTERALGKPVYVHCAHGHGRSALLLIACLLEAGQVGSWEEGLALLKTARPRVHLNRRQRAALEAWARSRCGAGGGGGRAAGLQMQALAAGGCVVSAAAIAAAAATAPSGLSITAAVQRRGSAGGASDGGAAAAAAVGGGGLLSDSGDADGGARVHLLADSRDAGLPYSTSVSIPYGLESRMSAGASGALHASGSLPMPLGETLRAAGAHVASVVASAATKEGGKKLS